MAVRMTETICAKSKLGHSLGQISDLTGLTIDEVKKILGQATGLTPEALSSILHMKQRGLSLELISQELDVELEVLEQFLPPSSKRLSELTH
jgi:predicted transposase YdaD